MNNLALSLISAILIGLGATLTLICGRCFSNMPLRLLRPTICLVGRWLRYMPEGIFKHSNIGSAPQKSAECTVGWIAHYMIGITFAIAFVAFVRQQLASASDADSRNRLRGRHGLGAILHHATCIWARICCIKDVKSYAGKTS